MTFAVVTEQLIRHPKRGHSELVALTLGHNDPACRLADPDFVIPANEAENEPWPCGQCVPVVLSGRTVEADVYRERPGGAHVASQTPAETPDRTPATVAQVVAAIRALPQGEKFTAADVTRPLQLWATEWAKTWEGTFEFMVDMRKAATEHRTGLSVGQAKGVLNVFRADYWRAEMAKREDEKKEAAARPAPAELDDAVYRVGDTYYMVYHTIHGANQQVAKKLIVTDTGQVDEDGHPIYEGEWEYVGKSPLRTIKPEMRLTQEEAAQFGKVYGLCVRCGRGLTRDESKHVGYGSTCAAREGWWYPTKSELAKIKLAS